MKANTRPDVVGDGSNHPDHDRDEKEEHDAFSREECPDGDPPQAKQKCLTADRCPARKRGIQVTIDVPTEDELLRKRLRQEHERDEAEEGPHESSKRRSEKNINPAEGERYTQSNTGWNQVTPYADAK